MQYSAYHNKIKRMADFLAKVYAHLALIITVAAILTAAAIATVAAKGMILSEETCAPAVVYGEAAPSYAANAFLGSVRYEYAEKGSEVWFSEPPVTVGTYQVRSVSTSSFGNPRYGKVQEFVISPRSLSILPASDTVVYGEAIVPSADALVYGDTVTCDFLYADITAKTTEVTADLSTVKITSPDGADRSENYVLTEATAAAMHITPRTLDITVSNGSKVYDNKVFSCQGYELPNGPAAEGDFLMAVSSTERTEAGSESNYITFRIETSDRKNVTDHYRLNITPGTLTVEQRPLPVQTGSYTKTYDGTVCECPEFTFKNPEDAAFLSAQGHTVIAENFADRYFAGSQDNTVELTVTDAEGNDKTANYFITYELGTLTVNKCPLVVTTQSGTVEYDATDHAKDFSTPEVTLPEGHYIRQIEGYVSMVNAGDYLNTYTVVSIAIEGEGATDSFDITYVYGTVTVTPRPLTVTTESATATYNGKAQRFDAIEFTPLLPQHAIAVGDNPPSFTDANVNTPHEGNNVYAVTVTSPDGDVTANYDISYVYGTVTVEPFALTLQPLTAVREYDATPLRAPDNEPEPNASLSEAIEFGTRIEFQTTGEQTEVGVGVSEIDPDSILIYLAEEPKEPKNHNFTVTCLSGTIEVTPRNVSITTADGYFVYDDNTHTQSSFVADNLVSGHIANVTVTGVAGPDISTAARIYENTVDEAATRITDDGGRDVTHNYSITHQYGVLTVAPRPLRVETETATEVYDGKIHSYPNFSVKQESEADRGLLSYHICRVTDGTLLSFQNITPSEGTTNEHTITVWDGEREVTENYLIEYDYGTVTVTARPLSVITEAATFVYDGETHTFGQYEFLDMNLPVYGIAEGHSHTAADLPSFTNAVSNQVNAHTVRITDEHGTDVTENYAIGYIYGHVTVKKRPVTVNAESATVVYNGRPRTFEALTLVPSMYLTPDTDGVLYPLLNGHTAEAVGHTFPTFTDVVEGASNPIPLPEHIKITDAFGRDVTANYDMNFGDGEVTITPYILTVKPMDVSYEYDGFVHEPQCNQFDFDPSDAFDEFAALGFLALGKDSPDTFFGTFSAEVGIYPVEINPDYFVIKDQDGRDVTANFTIDYQSGTIEITPYLVTVAPHPEHWVYDDLVHVSPFSAERDIDRMLPNHTIQVVLTGEAHEVGTYKNLADEAATRVFNADGEDVTSNFLFTYDYANADLTVEPRPYAIRTEGLEWVYDGQAHSNSAYTLIDLPNTHWISTHTTEIAVLPTFTDIPLSGNFEYNKIELRILKDGEDVTHNYVLDESSCEFATMVIRPRPVIVFTEDNTWVYDGADHTLGIPALAPQDRQYPVLSGHKAKAPADRPKFIEAGTYENLYDVLITDGTRDDLARNYDITYRTGTVTIKPRPVTVVTQSETVQFNGQDQTFDAFTVVASEEYPLLSGHNFRAQDVLSFLYIGEYSNEHTVRIIANRQDVTANYDITYEYGTVTILPCRVVLRPAKTTLVYNGEEQYAKQELEITEELQALLDVGYSYREYLISVTGSATTVGISNTQLTPDCFQLISPQGDLIDAAAAGFEFVYESGELEIVPRPVKLATESFYGELYYDGQGHTFSGVSDYGYQAEDGNYYWMLWDHTAVAVDPPAHIKAGVHENIFAVVIQDADGNDVTDCYEIHYEYGTVQIQKRPITVVTENGEWTFDGTEHICDALTLQDGEIWWSDMTFPVLEGLTATSLHPEKFLHAGVYYNGNVTVLLTNADGEDVTADHEITVQSGQVTVHPRPAILESESGSFTFDLQPHSLSGLTLLGTAEFPALAGHTAINLDPVSYTYIGEYPNDCYNWSIKDASGRDVTADYEIVERRSGTLQITPMKVTARPEHRSEVYNGTYLTPSDTLVFNEEFQELLTLGYYTYTAWVDGSILDVGTATSAIQWFYIFSPSGENITHCFEITTETGTLEVIKRPVTLVTEGLSGIVYDGNTYENPVYTLAADPGFPLLDGHTDTIEHYTSFVNAGDHENEITVRILRDGWEDVTSNFDFNYEYGIIEILPRPITVITADDTFVYDGTKHKYSAFTYEEDALYPLLSGHEVRLSAAVEFMYAGKHPNTPTVKIVSGSRDLTANYDITYQSGTVTITKRPVTVQTADLETVYTGRQISGHDRAELIGSAEYPVLTLHTAKAALIPVFVDAGEYENKFAAKIFDQEGDDVTHCYEITYEYGTVTITPCPITVQPQYTFKIYDGTPLYAQQALQSVEEIQDFLNYLNFTYSITVEGSQTEIGESESRITSFRMFNAEGVDATANFEITYLPGTVCVLPETAVKVLMYQLKKQYDGTPLTYTADDCQVISSLPQGWRIEGLTPHISMTEAGSLTLAELNENVESYISYRVFDADGNDRTADCPVLLVSLGSADEPVVQITPKLLELTSASETRQDNGTPLTSDTVFITKGSLVEGHTLHATTSCTLLKPGKEQNIIQSVTVLDADGNDVTDCYNIQEIYGWLTLTKAENR